MTRPYSQFTPALFLIASLAFNTVRADSNIESPHAPASTSEDSALIIKTVKWTNEARQSISNSWLSTARSLDAWMSGDDSIRKNKSRINIGLKQSFKKSGDNETDVYIRGKLDIPNTKRKLKLFFDSETNDYSSLEDKRLKTTEGSYSTAGVSRQKQLNNIELSNDIGAKFRVPLDPFYRTKVKYKKELSSDWLMGAEQRLWYYHEDGWGESSEIYFSTKINDQLLLRISTQAQYQKRFEEFEFGQFFTFYTRAAKHNWSSFTFGITGSSQPDPMTDSLFLSTNYKKLIHKDWVVLSMNPILRFPESDNWKPNPELEIRLDVYFQENPH